MLIREGKNSQIMSIMQTGQREGMVLLNQEMLRFVKEDVVEPMDCYMKAVDKEYLVKLFEANNIPFARPDE